MHNTNFTPNENSRTLYVVLSGISGGKDEPLVQHLSEAVKDHGAVLSVQFANDPLYHDSALPEMEEMSFDDCFGRLDEAFDLAGGTDAYTDIVFITHSFSSVIAAYYLGAYAKPRSPSPHYTLIIIDSDPSPKLLAYLDTLSAGAFVDRSQNPFHTSIIDYMREHDSTEVLKTLPVTVAAIEAEEIGSDHEFTSDESKRLLVEKILSSIPTHKD